MQILEGVKFMERTCVSVIVPIYNTKPWLEECIRSILDQKFDQPFEVILVDDGATDGCGELCDQMAARDKRIRVIHQENQGLSAARNTGIDAAQGRYYAFVDSDDILRPTYLQTLYDACEKHDAYMSICAVEDVREDGSSAEPPAYTMPSETGVFSGKELLNRFYAPNGTYYTVAWNKLYRAEVWKLLHYPEGRLHGGFPGFHMAARAANEAVAEVIVSGAGKDTAIRDHQDTHGVFGPVDNPVRPVGVAYSLIRLLLKLLGHCQIIAEISNFQSLDNPVKLIRGKAVCNRICEDRLQD